MKRVLFVTNLNEQSITFNILNESIPLHELQVEKIFFLQETPFENLSNELSNYDIKSEIIINKTIKWSHILNTARANAIELIIIHNVKKLASSLILKLINKSHTPILFVKQKNKESSSNKKNIFSHTVFATDWSSASEKALNFILTFKKIIKEMEIVNVINKKLTIRDIRELKEKISKTRKICLNEKIDAEAHIYAGKTADEILLAARDYKSTIIVIGKNAQKKYLKNYFKKNLSKIVIENSNLPVLIIPSSA